MLKIFKNEVEADAFVTFPNNLIANTVKKN